MKVYTAQELKARFSQLGFKWDEDFNIIGIRSQADKPDVFDDQIYIVTKNNLYVYKATTNPGVYWLTKFANPKGSAVLKSDMQHVNMWTIGLHRGKYEALVQASPVKVYRDNNKNNKSEEIGELDSGYFGINGHHAKPGVRSVFVGQWSAGCQVWEDYGEYQQALGLCKHSGKKYFTYTLLKEF